LLHYTAMATVEEALERLCDPKSQVSAHYVVAEDGTCYGLVEEGERAWHAGVSFWRGERNVNSASISIEIANPGDRPFPKAQMESLAALCTAILGRHAIPARNVVGHSDVAPQRKDDPGALFNWSWLAAQGVGVWPTPADTPVPDALAALAEYGYEFPTGADQVPKVITAFQRHFRPSQVDGRWDDDCGRILAGLLRISDPPRPNAVRLFLEKFSFVNSSSEIRVPVRCLPPVLFLVSPPDEVSQL